MKFSEINREQWAPLKTYFDTCLLPLTGLTGKEEPWQVTEALERLRDTMEHLENAYKGRIVTYPAVHYMDEQGDFAAYIDRICQKIKESGFTYVILIAADRAFSDMTFPSADLFLYPDSLQERDEEGAQNKPVFGAKVESLWRKAQN